MHKEGEVLYTLNRIWRNLVYRVRMPGLAWGQRGRLWEGLWLHCLGSWTARFPAWCLFCPSFPRSFHSSSLLPVHVMEVGSRMGGSWEGERKEIGKSEGKGAAVSPASRAALDSLITFLPGLMWFHHAGERHVVLNLLYITKLSWCAVSDS